MLQCLDEADSLEFAVEKKEVEVGSRKLLIKKGKHTKMENKFLGKKYQGWKVTKVTKVNNGTHKRYTLVKSDGYIERSITLRDNAMTKLDNKTRTVISFIAGKKVQREVFNKMKNNTEKHKVLIKSEKTK